MSDPDAVTVLVVDDDAMVLEIYRLALERSAFNVVVALDGVAALAMIAAAAPDIILLDIKMPRMDGLEVLARLRASEATRGIPVVVLSNFDDPALVSESHRLGAKQYCIKANVNPLDLAEMCRTWLPGRQ